MDDANQACFSGKLEAVKVLVEYGAKIDARDESQQTPEDVARRFNHDDVYKYMKEEAPQITLEAREKYSFMASTGPSGAGDASLAITDPIITAIQNNEEENLERIVKTAAKVSNDQPKLVYPVNSNRITKANPQIPPNSINNLLQKQLIIGAIVFVVTFSLGLALGRRSAASSRPQE